MFSLFVLRDIIGLIILSPTPGRGSEVLMYSYVSGADAKERTRRVVVAGWKRDARGLKHLVAFILNVNFIYRLVVFGMLGSS